MTAPPDSADESRSKAPDHSIWQGVCLVLAFLASWRVPGDPLNYRQRKADWLGRLPLPPPQVSFGRRAAGVTLLVTGALMLIWAADARIEGLFWPAFALLLARALLMPGRRY